MKCELNHEDLRRELYEKRFTIESGSYVCPDCGVILVKVIPRSVERQNWIDKYGDKNDI